MASFSDPTIEVLSKAPRYELIMGRLRHAGLRPIRASLRSVETHFAPLLLDQVGAPDEVDKFLSAAPICSIASKRPVIIISAAGEPRSNPSVLHLHSVDQIATLPTRLSIRLRETRRIQEAHLRAETAKKLGEPDLTPAQPKANRVLFLGECSARFIEINAALKACGIETVAAISHVTAGDYLISGAFQAVMLYPKQITDEASLYLQRYKSLLTPAHVQICVLEAAGLKLTPAQRDEARVNHFIADTLSADQIAEQMTSVIEQGRRPEQSPQAAAPPVPPASTRLFSRRFLEAHVAEQISETEEHGEALSLISVASQDPDKPLSDLAGIILPHLRDTDLVAHFSGRTLCVSLRATPYRGAVTLARRIEKAFDGPITWRAVERRRFHTQKTLFGAIAQTPQPEQRRSA